MEQIADGVWGVRGEARMPGGVTFPLRMTVVRLPDDSLWLHSPVAIDDATAAALQELGPVGHIVAPTRMHDLYLQSAQARWPEAQMYAPEGVDVAGVRIDVPLTETSKAAWHGAIDSIAIDGASRLREHAFLHVPSRTLLVADLVFNFAGSNLATRTMLWLVGCNRGMAASRSWGWVFADDKGAVAASVRRILEWDFARVVPCHGDVVQADAHDALTQATTRLLAWDRA